MIKRQVARLHSYLPARLRSYSHSQLQLGALWWGQCLLCRHDCQQQALICQQCRNELPQLSHPCSQCAFPLTLDDAHCGRCQRYPQPWQRMQVLADFEPPFSGLIHGLKYHHQTLNGRLLGQLLAQQVSPPYPEAILPVPLHWWRQLRRGYNQAFEIALGMQNVLPIQIDNHSLKRRRHTATQTQLTRIQRQKNLHQAFTARSLPYRHVALLDDVITTGSTMKELTQLLHQQGVEVVEVWALCRTLDH
ncbi:ComF family protein [Oceanisphaera sp. IT1-181]|uniref:ComF family protein n=1 Tax=Oceanisphaera sp. IT1-181 TaxID=3081199 RepID=UPI0029C9F983|nr:ComF family protein [Oceanisphaera sp. IT1-181]